MNGNLDARIEVARGELVIGPLVVPMTPDGAAGEWRVGGASGPLLRSLRYGERTRLAALAAASDDPRGAVAAAIARVATVSDGVVDDVVREVAALILSGARDAGASFGQALLRVGRAGGWDLTQLMDAPADEVDRLARMLGEPPDRQVRLAANPTTATHQHDSEGGGWNRLVFDDGSGTSSANAIRDMLADNLLARVEGPSPDTDESDPDANWGKAGSTPDSSIEAADPVAPRAAEPAGGWPSHARPRLEAPALVLPSRWFTRATVSSAATLSAASGVPASDARDGRVSALPDTDASTASQPWGPAPTGAGPGRLGAVAAPAGSGVRQLQWQAVSTEGPAARRGPSAVTFEPRASRRDRLGLGAVSVASSDSPARPSASWTSGLLRTAMVPASPASSTMVGVADGLAPEWADALAALLQDEADLRGVE